MRSFARDHRFANDGAQPSAATRDHDAATERVGKATQVDRLYGRAADASEVEHEGPRVGHALEALEVAAERVHLASARTIQALAGQAAEWDPERAQARLEQAVDGLARTIDAIAPTLADLRPSPKEPTGANLDPRAGTRTTDKKTTVDIARTRLDPERQTSYRLEGLVENDADKAARAEIKRITAALPAAQRALKNAQKLASDAAKQAKKTTAPPAALADVEKAVTDAQAGVDTLVAELRANEAIIHDNSARQREELVSGDPNASEFWCSGLTIWTLASAGYNLEAPLLGSEDQKPFRYQSGKRTSTITLKALIDGEPPAVEAAIYIQRNGLTRGAAQVIPLSSEPLTGGHRLGYDAAGHATSDAVKGAAGALAMFGIGTEVPPEQRKPGDFAQRRDVSAANVTHELQALEKELAAEGSDVSAAAVARDIAALESEQGAPDLDEKAQQAKTDRLTHLHRLTWLREEASTEIHRGKGHAWQVTEVQVKGDALFGAPQSPRLVSGTGPAEPTWLTDTLFVITADTNPALVGTHEIRKDRIIEANIPNPKAGFAGGVHEPEAFSDKRVSASTSVVFYGRLETSPWVNWQPADEASARAAASARE